MKRGAHSPEVKLCAAMSAEDVDVTDEFGAHAVGIIIGEGGGPHRVTLEEGAEVGERVPDHLATVLLMPHIEDPDRILAVADTVQADVIQLSTDASLDTAKKIAKRRADFSIVQVFYVDASITFQNIEPFLPYIDAIHLDSRHGEMLGGTGRTHDWSVSAAIVAEAHERGVPVILSGGLNADNVAEAIEHVKPDAVDVETGIKAPDKTTSRGKAGAFIGAVRGVRLDYEPLPVYQPKG
jgi:phosphoribosylanthranilate isomerase